MSWYVLHFSSYVSEAENCDHIEHNQHQLFLPWKALFVFLPYTFAFNSSICYPGESIIFKQSANLLDRIRSCRLVLHSPHSSPMGSISVNTTFHLEPPAWQACLRICFGFGGYDYGNKSLVHIGSKLKRFYSHLKAWCFYWKHKRLSQGSYSPWHHPKECLVAKSWSEVMTAPTELLIKTHLSDLFYLALTLLPKGPVER